MLSPDEVNIYVCVCVRARAHAPAAGCHGRHLSAIMTVTMRVWLWLVVVGKVGHIHPKHYALDKRAKLCSEG
jgi:hypothetical protein